MPVKIWPQEFEKKEHINASERFLLRNALRNFRDGYFVVGIDPVGLSTEQVHMGMYIKPTEGLITFSIYQEKISQDLIPSMLFTHEMAEQAIYDRLLDSKMLIVQKDNKKILKFPYKHILLFPQEDIPVTSCDDDSLLTFSPYSAIRFFVPTAIKKRPTLLKELRIFENVRMQYDSGFQRISEAERLAIFERLAPEYTVVMKEKEIIEVPETEDDVPDESEEISGNEFDYKTFQLDDYQVAQINDMGRGHRVILANAGAGKSVLLLSKAFKYAGMYKNSNILLTCYNNNLADSYRFRKSKAGITSSTNRRLHILTLHKLVAKLYYEYLKITIDEYASEEQIRECVNLVKDNTIPVRFKAIFIDEVQIFEPLYLELCYALLEKSDSSLFLMAGDLNQTVRSQSRKGDAPWKKIEGVDLDFTGRVKYIERNYRNSPDISAFLNRMLIYMNAHLSKLNMINIDEFEYDTFGKGANENIALNIVTGIDRKDIKKAVIDAVEEISSKHHIPYSDIAILYPYRENKALNYYIQYWIRSGLEEKRIRYSIISRKDDGQKDTYSSATGLVVSSIDSALGLDFRAVILAGLYPFTYVYDDNGRSTVLKSWKKIGSLSEIEKEKVQIQMRKLYTACSRAREVLYVLSDITEDTVIEDIIKSGEE